MQGFLGNIKACSVQLDVWRGDASARSVCVACSINACCALLVHGNLRPCCAAWVRTGPAQGPHRARTGPAQGPHRARCENARFCVACKKLY